MKKVEDMSKKLLAPDYLFEVSWEICNKVGGIHTVISTKAITLVEELQSNYILIGPDVWRESYSNPEFIEDPQLFKSWRAKAAEEGLRIRVGNWNISGKPIAIIVDFSPFIDKKDEVFKKFWELYKLDSISGQWDYVEPALFGWAAAKVIESFTRFHLSLHDKVVAQFHEWMTGSGLLYLKEYMPQIATIFTTHATVLGRSIAGNLQPLYSKLKEYNGDVKASEFNVISKQSCEKLSARHADCFVTVSDITARECEQFLEKPVDLVTPNGFEDTFVPQGEAFHNTRKTARERFLQVSNALLGTKLDEETVLVGISGRYEFKNKGIEIFIDCLGKLNANPGVKKNIVAYILIPANHYGPRKDLLHIINGEDCINDGNKFLSHNLHDQEYDPILNRIEQAGLTNAPGDKVKVIFVPCYLNGNDGLFNLPYYDLLCGLDLTVFPSYYEPWGYTPLESLAFHVPTVTTTLAGFGMWVKEHNPDVRDGINVIFRDDDNDVDVTDAIVEWVAEFTRKSAAQVKSAREEAFQMSRIALWKNFISYYKEAYQIALEKAEGRKKLAPEVEHAEQVSHMEKYKMVNQPLWKRLIVHKNIPEKLSALDTLSRNLWWCWNVDAQDLFESIDPQLWKESEGNPILLLEKISYNKFLKLESNREFTGQLDKVYSRFKAYMDKKNHQQPPKIAYFSMEYGLHESLKIYSGGLGILAGDYLKEASDQNVEMVGIGLLYRYGYFTQVISASGDQLATYELQHFSKLPTQPARDKNGNWITISLAFPGRTLYARVWKVEVGRVDLYLLDTDYEDNTDQDKTITHYLYGGNNENRFKQEVLLGVGGIRALKELGYHADVYHCNEGHAAFIGLERLHYYINDLNLAFPEALEIVRASTLFTTHTPVPAGHDFFDEGLLRMYMAHYPERLKIPWHQFMGLGRINPYDQHEKFSMSFLAANLSQEVNGVSRLHGKVSQEIFNVMWQGYNHDELHLGYVTNGVHYPTWTAKEWRQLYEKVFGDNFVENQLDKTRWSNIYDVADQEIWKIRNSQRKKLIEYIKERLKESSLKRYENPKSIVEIQEKLNKFTLTIGFARRFATYKRAHLLFRNLDRLARIVNNPGMPVQFIFAGKAHPADKAGQDLIKMIVNLSHRPEFVGKIIFLPNYDMELGRKLVQGVDIWLNTPTRPLEASGTSGEKAVMNGGLHFSVLDGWWAEGYQPDAGWALPEEQTYQDNDFQDELDAEIIYSLLENEIAPLFYFRDDDDVPTGWVRYIKNSIARVASNYTTTRMLNDYIEQYYKKLYERSQRVVRDDFALAKDLASWKKKIYRAWESIEVISVKSPDVGKEPIVLGKSYSGEVVLDLNELSPNDIGVEIVIAETDVHTNKMRIVHSQAFEIVDRDGQKVKYHVEIVPTQTGVFDFGIRVYPKHPELPHRQDFNFVKWI